MLRGLRTKFRHGSLQRPLGRKNCIKRLPTIVVLAQNFDGFAGVSGGAGNFTDALQSALNLSRRVNMLLTSASCAKRLRTEDKSGD